MDFMTVFDISAAGMNFERTRLEGSDIARAVRRPNRRLDEHVPVTVAFLGAQRAIGDDRVGHAIAIEVLMEAGLQRFQRNATIVPTMINHQPAFLYYLKGRLFICQVFSISPDGDKVAQIDNVIDPDKLKAIADRQERK